MYSILLLSLALINDGEARRKRPKAKKAKTEQAADVSEQDVFNPVYEALKSGQKQQAINLLWDITQKAEYQPMHGRASIQMAALLREQKLPYAAMMFYHKAIKSGSLQDVASKKKAITELINLSDIVGDSQLLTELLTEDLPLEDSTRSRLNYLKARAQVRQGNYNSGLELLSKIKDDSPDFIESLNLRGVILSQQGQYGRALVPFQIGLGLLKSRKESEKLQNILTINMGRAFYAAGNFPQAAGYFLKIPRNSQYWLEAQFEAAWAFFRMKDVNRVLGILQTHTSPQFAEEHYPEGELLRIYSLFLMCKFEEADRQITKFEKRFTPHQKQLNEWQNKRNKELFAATKNYIEKKPSRLPYMVARNYIHEDRMLSNIKAINQLKKEQTKLRSMQNFSGDFIETFQKRERKLSYQEGRRIQRKIAAMHEEISGMLKNLTITKLDIKELQATMLEQAARKGKKLDARRLAKRKEKKKANHRTWPFQGEFWADELGYYKIKTKSECPATMRPDQNVE